MDEKKGVDVEVIRPTWERIAYNGTNHIGNRTYRMKIFGGWLVTEEKWSYGQSRSVSTSITFVPDKYHEWRIR